MLLLQRNETRGRKRLRPRIEELIRIDVHGVVTHKPWVRSTVFDGNGNKIQFVTELVGDEQRLVVYVNGAPQLSFILVDVPITGRIKNPIPWDRNRIYYVLDNGKRYRSIYIDPEQKKIGSRHALRAVYTSQSVGKKQQQFWRELRKLWKFPRQLWPQLVAASLADGVSIHPCWGIMFNPGGE